MKAIHMVAFILLVIGGLNWLAVAFGLNVIEAVFGTGAITMVIYILVGLAALVEIFGHKRNCRVCATQ
jgi:uncharacterized membrane protein YuzA (DUF378 family)